MILQYYYDRATESVEFVTKIFQQEGAAIPIGFTEKTLIKRLQSYLTICTM